PRHGMIFKKVENETMCLVPKTGNKNVLIILKIPPDNPGMAASQNNWSLVKLKPIPLSFTTNTLIINHVANEKVRAAVVIHSVFQAICSPPSSSQKSSFSASQVVNHVFDMFFNFTSFFILPAL